MKRTILALSAVLGIIGGVHVAFADHAWGTYHIARSSNPFVVTLGDNLSVAWDSYLAVASQDWSQSSVLDTVITPGQSPLKNCKPVLGRVELCNSKYGQNGWLGIASIWTSGDHITQSTVKMNDTYFAQRTYNTPAWKQLVLCQEIGHAFGLDHQDEAFANANLGTCMDYTNSPADNQHPNLHDYDMLEQLYAHFDSSSTAITSAPAEAPGLLDMNNMSEWGKEIHRSADGRASLFERELGGGHHVYTHVFWAIPVR